MKIRIIRNTVVNGQAVNIGEVVDVSEAEAHLLIAIGKAAPFQPVESPAIETTDAPMPAIESTDVKPPKRKRG